METTLADIQAVAKLVLALGEVERATRHPDGSRPETDTTHTVMLALVAITVAPEHGLDLVRFALVHDLVEAYAGDTNTLGGLSEGQRMAKKEREHRALQKITADFAGTSAAWIPTYIEQYEQQKHPAATLVHLLDKLVPKLTHTLNGCAVARSAGMSKADLSEFMLRQAAELRQEHPNQEQVYALLDQAREACLNAYGEPA